LVPAKRFNVARRRHKRTVRYGEICTTSGDRVGVVTGSEEDYIAKAAPAASRPALTARQTIATIRKVRLLWLVTADDGRGAFP
jgi:hypothetical protein